MTTIPGISGNWRKVDSRHGMNLYESVEYGRNIPMLVVDDSGNLIKETRGSLSVAMGDRHERKSVFASSNRRSKGPVVSGNRRGGFLGSRNSKVIARPVDIDALASDLLLYLDIEHYELADYYDDPGYAYDDLRAMLTDPSQVISIMDRIREDMVNGEAMDETLAVSIYNRLSMLSMCMSGGRCR